MKKQQLDIILRGSPERIPIKLFTAAGKLYQDFNFIEGIGSLIERRYAETPSERHRAFYKSFLTEKKCHLCNGQRLNDAALAVKISKLNIMEFCHLPINIALNEILRLDLSATNQKIANLIVNEIYNRLNFLNEVGLSYLTLSRTAQTLSGGESQRIRLATQIGSKLTGVLYVLDEPSIGLHQKDNERLLSTLFHLRDLGNTLLVVEHDNETLDQAD